MSLSAPLHTASVNPQQSVRLHGLLALATLLTPTAQQNHAVANGVPQAVEIASVVALGHELQVLQTDVVLISHAEVDARSAGESVTSKTLAAELRAHELQLDLYRIDQSAVVSIYIGEKGKSLRRVFDATEESGAILLFDEADVLFGKCCEVEDSHGRYANIEVTYLLQRIESYRALAILTTNLKALLDVAFQRRQRLVVNFPFPDQALREAIWRGAFPARSPLYAIDNGKLACLIVSGGSIVNIAINVTLRADELDKPISMVHLLHSAHFEASKRERPLIVAETRRWV